MRSRLFQALVLCFIVAIGAGHVLAQSVDPAKLPGIVIDDRDAERKGKWTDSTSVKPYVGVGYIHASGDGQFARFKAKVPEAGKYQILVAYTPGTNRPDSAPIHVESPGLEKQTVHINQRNKPVGPYAFQPIGEYEFAKDAEVTVTVSTDGTSGAVIADAVQILTVKEFELAKVEAKKNPVALVNKPPQPKKKAEKKPEPPKEKTPEFKPIPPTRIVRRVDAKSLEDLITKHIGEIADEHVIGDELFLRRATLDIIGRQPTKDEVEQFVSDESADKRAKAVDRLLASPDYGRNWANYWSDVISYRQQEPELTFHDYGPFKIWLADKLNEESRWDAIVYEMLTATGKVGAKPATTFVAFHQANAHRIAGETTRVFMAVKIACAECHDHPFIDMPTETFHGIAAYFARTEAKVAQLNSKDIEVKSKTKGEHKIPGKGGEMKPTAFTSDSMELGESDLKRRAALAHWLTSGDNELFAKSYVNRIWSRTIGRGFAEPVDDLGEGSDCLFEDVHSALADHLVAAKYDTKELLRVIINTRLYQRSLVAPLKDDAARIADAKPKKLRGDEVFDSLVTAIGLPNVTPEREKKTADVRFPPPPKSTRDLVNDAFGYDPSFPQGRILRTMKQAMFMMNNEQLQKQIDSSPGSETMLAKLVANEADDEVVAASLYVNVLSRHPTEKELNVVLDHIGGRADRGEVFEDVLWSLINSAEFTTRR